MHLVSPKAKISKISFEKVKSITMPRKDGFFHRQEWPVPTAGKQSHSPFPSPSEASKPLHSPSVKTAPNTAPHYYSAQTVEIGPPHRQNKLHQNLEVISWNKFTS